MLKFILNRLNDGETNPSQAHGQVLALAGPVPGPPPGRKTGLPKPEPVETSNVPTTRLNRHTQPDVPNETERNKEKVTRRTPTNRARCRPLVPTYPTHLKQNQSPAAPVLSRQITPSTENYGKLRKVTEGYGRLRKDILLTRKP